MKDYRNNSNKACRQERLQDRSFGQPAAGDELVAVSELGQIPRQVVDAYRYLTRYLRNPRAVAQRSCNGNLKY